MNICLICGKEIETEWRAKSTLKHVEKGRAEPFENLKYCSKECWRKRGRVTSRVKKFKKLKRNEVLKKPQERNKCIICSKDILFGKSFCSCECMYSFRHKQKQERDKEILKKILKEKSLQSFYNSKTCDIPAHPKGVYKNFLLEQKKVCDICKNRFEWLGKPLVPILDHIDGNYLNNSLENLRIICPNCNSQLETTGSRNKGKGRPYYRKSLEY